MSYILDALRKSEQQRQHGAAPTLSSAQFSAPATGGRKAGLAVLALGLLLAGILIGWWQAMPPLASSPSPAPAVELRPGRGAVVEVPAASANAPSAVPEAREPGAAVPAGASDRQAAVAKAPASLPGEREREPVRSEIKPAVMPQQEAATRENRAAAEPKADPRIMSRTELPPAVQQELPGFVVSLHAYSSKPENRLVSVNDRLLHEGDSLAAGLVLEQIRPEDMVFTYKGFRFRQGLQ